MNRVLEYSARHARRGTTYGTASMLMAGLVLTVPAALAVGNAVIQHLVMQPHGFLLLGPVSKILIDGPFLLIFILPLVGLILGALGLALRCKRNTLVVLAILVNISGLIAATGAIYLKG